MQLPKYSPSIINIKENPHKVHNKRKRNWNIFQTSKRWPKWMGTHQHTMKDGWYVIKKQFSVEFQFPS